MAIIILWAFLIGFIIYFFIAFRQFQEKDLRVAYTEKSKEKKLKIFQRRYKKLLNYLGLMKNKAESWKLIENFFSDLYLIRRIDGFVKDFYAEDILYSRKFKAPDWFVMQDTAVKDNLIVFRATNQELFIMNKLTRTEKDDPYFDNLITDSKGKILLKVYNNKLTDFDASDWFFDFYALLIDFEAQKSAHLAKK